MAWFGEVRQGEGEAWLGVARQGMARQGKARQGVYLYIKH